MNGSEDVSRVFHKGGNAELRQRIGGGFTVVSLNGKQ